MYGKGRQQDGSDPRLGRSENSAYRYEGHASYREDDSRVRRGPGEFDSLDDEDVRYDDDRNEGDILVRRKQYEKYRHRNAYSGDTNFATDRYMREDAYRPEQRRDDRNDISLEMDEFPHHDQRQSREHRVRGEERGRYNADFEDDLEPDYDDGEFHNKVTNRVTGFERTRKYYDPDIDRPKNHSPSAMPSRKSYHQEEEELYEEIDPIPGSSYTAIADDGGMDNHGFEHDVSDDGSNASFYKQRELHKLLRRRSTRPLRGQNRAEDRYSMPYTEAVKTLVKCRRAQSMMMPGTMSSPGQSEEAGLPDYDSDSTGEDKLPSNRHRKTERLAQRMQHLSKKREVSTHEMATLMRDQILSREPSLLTGVALWKYQLAMQWLRFKNWSKNWIYQLELWAGAFKQIEGQFGTATMTYFRFLRWLMFLNLFITLFMVLIILLPFMLLKPTNHHDFPKSVNRCMSEYHYEAVYFSTNYTQEVQERVKNESAGQYVLDVLQGTGWLENTELFYGIYFNKTATVYYNETATVAGNDSYTYNMSLAYLCAMGAGFLLSFVLLVKNSAKGMKQSAVATGGSSITLFCNKVFGAWDYCISQDKTAHLKYKTIRQDLLNELEYQRLQWKKASRSTKERVKLYTIRVLINIAVIAILSGSLYLIYYTNEQLLNVKDDPSIDKVVLLIIQYLPSISITLLNVTVPFIFYKVIIAEDYMPAYRTRITLIRIVLLRLASLGILMLSLYNTLAKRTTEPEVNIPCDNIHPSHTNTSNHVTETAGNQTNKHDGTLILCWETYVGQQIYKLVILNFLVVVSVTFVWEFPRKLIFDRFHESVKLVNLLGQQEFDLSKSVLDLIYLQALCWLGMFFSPLIPAMCFVKLFIFFYIKKGSLLRNCLPVQQYGTSRSNSLFMLVLLMAFALASIPLTFMVGSMQPSKGCGPFRVYSDEDYVMFNVVGNLIYSWDVVRDVLPKIAEGRTMVLIGFILCLLMYYFYVVGQAHYKMSKKLREQLKVEGQDKQFLLARVNETLAWNEEQEEEDGT